MGPEDLAGSVPEARPNAAGTATKVTRVLVEHDRKYGLRHVVPNSIVGVSCTEVVCIAANALAERRICVRQLRLRAEQRAQGERPTVERIESRNVKFLSRRDRLIWRGRRRRAGGR